MNTFRYIWDGGKLKKNCLTLLNNLFHQLPTKPTKKVGHEQACAKPLRGLSDKGQVLVLRGKADGSQILLFIRLYFNGL